MHFKDKVIWITGASSGIGAELARQLARLNAKLILTSRNIPVLQAIKDECLQLGSACSVLPGNMLDSNSINDLTNSAIAVFGTIDIVIFSAGVSQRSLASDTTMEVYCYLMELNFFAPVAITKSLLPHFAMKDSGQIVVLSSMAGLMGFPLRTGYAAAKHALKGFFETLQIEQMGSGLSITIVSPGRINTPISLNAVVGNGDKYGLMDRGQLNGIPVDVCARKILKAVQLRRRHVIIAESGRILWWIWWYMRPLYYKIAYRKGTLV
jgi:dehydrogenase/reductase SDR family protein 7B